MLQATLLFPLAASALWAPAVLAAAGKAERGLSRRGRERLWIGALIAAAAPTLLAPAMSPALSMIHDRLPAATASMAVVGSQAAPLPPPAIVEASSVPTIVSTMTEIRFRARLTDPDATRAPVTETTSGGSAPLQHRAGQADAAAPSFERIEAPTMSPAQPFLAGWATAAAVDVPDAIPTGLWLVYLYGVALAAALAAARAGAFAIEVARATPIARRREIGGEHDLAASLEPWRERFGLKSLPQIRESRVVPSVCLHGVFRPTIVIPSAVLRRAASADLALMCAHELAHVRRGDALLFTLTAGVRTVFWFNPFIRAIAGRVELAAEEAADALVLAGGADRRAYAACFLEALKAAAGSVGALGGAHAVGPSFTPADRAGRRRRLQAILGGDLRRPLSWRRRIGLGAMAAFAAALGIAQSSAPAGAPTNAPTNEPVTAQAGEPTAARPTMEIAPAPTVEQDAADPTPPAPPATPAEVAPAEPTAEGGLLRPVDLLARRPRALTPEEKAAVIAHVAAMRRDMSERRAERQADRETGSRTIIRDQRLALDGDIAFAIVTAHREAADMARRSGAEIEREFRRVRAEAEREMARAFALGSGEPSADHARVLPGKDIEAARKRVDDARAAMARRRSETRAALEDAEEVIARQQAEIERLRAELAAARAASAETDRR